MGGGWTQTPRRRLAGRLAALGAVAHAIANVTGVWIKNLPITPERILKALCEKPAAGESVAV